MAFMEQGSMNNDEGNQVMKDIKKEMMSPDAKGMGLAQVMGLSDEEVKATYTKASQLLAANDVFSAGKLFMTLCALNHTDYRHWRGLGVCSQRLTNHSFANWAYTKALKRNPEDVVSLVFRGEARINLGQVILARDDLEKAIQLGNVSKDREARVYANRAKKVLQMVSAGDESGSFEK
jgi:Flp pilus assembly protein TadD